MVLKLKLNTLLDLVFNDSQYWLSQRSLINDNLLKSWTAFSSVQKKLSDLGFHPLETESHVLQLQATVLIESLDVFVLNG